MPPLLRASTFRARKLRREATPAERALWQLLRGRQLGAKFKRQQPLGPYIVDFFCEEAWLVIELDGAGHFPRPQTDIVRDTYLARAGLKILRFWNADVMRDSDRVLMRIRFALSPLLRERGRG